MSYLNALRLHFAGLFQANISTVNNDPAHFYNATFQPNFQEMQGPNMNPPNGWFNPQGDANFRLLGCKVTTAWTPSGQVQSPDPVLGCAVADSDTQAPAKLVDLDSEQQLVSEIWGLQVRLVGADGKTLLRGDFEPAGFIDIWSRAPSNTAAGDNAAGAMYQSVLTNLQWGDVLADSFLGALRQAAGDGLLSIKFNVDGINMSMTDPDTGRPNPDFMCGRITGTIGPAAAGEPHHMVMGRQFMANCPPTGGFPAPDGQINFCACVVDKAAQLIYLDLGNALPTTVPRGPLAPLGDLSLGTYTPSQSGNSPGTINPLPGATLPQSTYLSDSWYSDTAGVAVLPLSADVSTVPLVITGTKPGVIINEWASGAFLRADRFVYRMSPGDKNVQIPVYATQWGEPLKGANVSFQPDASQLQPTLVGSGQPYGADGPPVGTWPAESLGFDPNATVATDENGLAVLTLNPTDPGMPRYFGGNLNYGIDGQIYGVRPTFMDPQFNGGYINQWNFISILLWSEFRPSDPVTWADLQPIFQQYANLYPVMNRFLDLSSYDDVVKNAGLLQLAFGLDEGNPNLMPVTRDLSPAKRNAILAWLKDPQHPRGGVRTLAAAPEARAAAPAGVPGHLAVKGGKAAALARRLVLQNK
ncbi:MAG TPA: hypothetical protein VGX48_25140 [Pyrinomonadaceae bacterium]|jgi:hypothetical protein|nr:hypothetical protein [Pyrinomonadaceae bacterium]